MRDANGCFEKDMSNNEKTRIQTITQPAEPIKIDFSKVSDPLGFGRTDGNIKRIVKGGTPKTGSTYNITWKKLDGTVLSSLAIQRLPLDIRQCYKILVKENIY